MKKILLLTALVGAISTQATPYYTGLTGGWFKSGDVESWGGNAYVGYEFTQNPELVHAGVEFEIGFLDGDAKHSGRFSVPNEAAYNPVAGWSTTTNHKVDFTQIPLMVNCRLWGHFMKDCPLAWYAGAGLGVEWQDSKDHRSFSLYNATGVAVPIPAALANEFAPRTKKDRSWKFAGQVFAGLGYMFHPQWCVHGGIRARLIDSHTWGNYNDRIFDSANIHTDSLQLGGELGLTYNF